MHSTRYLLNCYQRENEFLMCCTTYICSTLRPEINDDASKYVTEVYSLLLTSTICCRKEEEEEEEEEENAV